VCKFGGEIPRVPGAAIKNPCLTVHFVLLGFSYWIFESNLTGQRQNRAPRNGIHSHAYAFCVKTLLHMQQKKDSPYTSIALFILLKKGNNFSLGLKTEHLPQSSTLFKYSTKSKKKKKIHSKIKQFVLPNSLCSWQSRSRNIRESNLPLWSDSRR